MAGMLCMTGLGYYVPERVVRNDELSGLVDTSDEWIRSRTGIEERRLAAPGQTCSDLVAEASRRALVAAGLEAGALTHLIVCTASGDAAFPATASYVQGKLGVRGMAFDLGAACSGFLYGMKAAQGFLAHDPKAVILLAGAEILSHRVNWTDRGTCVLFGDGAGAAVLQAGPRPGQDADPLAVNAAVEGILCDGDGAYTDFLYCNGGCTKAPYKLGDTVGPEYFIDMKGREVFKHAVRTMSAVSLELLDKLGLSMADIDLLIPHQANSRIIAAVAERLDAPPEKVFMNLQKYGNTSAASIPLALGEAVEQGVIRPGMRVLFSAFGAGLTWGAALVRF